MRDFSYCGNHLGIIGFKPGIKGGSSVLLAHMMGNLRSPGQQKQYKIWTDQNKKEGIYDAYIFLQIFDKEIKEKFERCTQRYFREELPDGQVHLSRPEQVPLVEDKSPGGFASWDKGF